MKSIKPYTLQGIAFTAILMLTFTTNYNANAESLTVNGDLDVKGIVTVGNNLDLTEIPPGSIRWRQALSVFEGYDGTSWNTFPLSVFNDDGTTSWGNNTSASGNFATAWGNGNSASGKNATTWGFGNTVSGETAAAWGRENTVEGDFSNAWGFKNVVNGINVTAWGRENVAAGKFSTVWGSKNNTNGLYATAWGYYVNAPSYLSTAFGKYNIGSVSISDDGNDSNDGDKVWKKLDSLIEIGIGVDDQNRANALTLLKDGRIALGKHDTLDLLQNKTEAVQIMGAIKVGDYPSNPGANASEGSIRLRTDASGNNDLLGYVNGSWRSLIQSGGGGDQTLSISGNQLTISGPGGNTVTLPSGNDSADGQNSTKWYTGSSGPANSVGLDGDLYLNTSNGDIFRKTSGSWGNSIGNLRGLRGPEGASPFLLDGDNAYYTAGNVGIGVETPSEMLDVSGNIQVGGMIFLTTPAGDIPSMTY